jgi:hypothetical protein
MTEIINSYGFDLKNPRPHLFIAEHNLPHHLGCTERSADHCDDIGPGKNYNHAGFFRTARVYFLSNVALKRSPLPQRKLINPFYGIYRTCGYQSVGPVSPIHAE